MAGRAGPRWARWLTVAVAMGLSSPGWSFDARLESLKQNALALYTVSLAERRRFVADAMVLVGAETQRRQLRELSIAFDGKAWAEYRYHPREAELLAGGALQQLGIVELAMGARRVSVRAVVADPDGSARQSLETERELRVDAWPRGLVIMLSADGTHLELRSPLPAGALLKAADFELALGHPGKAVTLLQNLSHVDTASARSPAYLERMGRSLSGWGLNAAAEGVYRDLGRSAADAQLRLSAWQRAAELALSRGAPASARQYLDDASWPASMTPAVEELRGRVLLAEGRLEQARERLPAGTLWRYNLAAALQAAGDGTAAEAVLGELAEATPGTTRQRELRDLAALKLGYRRLEQGDAVAAHAAFSRISPDGRSTRRGLLGRGWASLDAAGSVAEPDGDAADIRPRHVRRIEAALAAAEQVAPRQRQAALRAALRDWSLLQSGDPLDPAVQEGLVAAAYALDRLGNRREARAAAELAVSRLDAVREVLNEALASSRDGPVLDARTLARQLWPPQPGQSADWAPVENWWRDESPVAADAVLRPWLLREAPTLRALQAMRELQEAESLARAAAEEPSLRARSEQLQRVIEVERERRQTGLRRHLSHWLRNERERVTRYLVMGRLVLAHALEEN